MREREERKKNGDDTTFDNQLEAFQTLFVGNEKEDEDVFCIKNGSGDVNDSQMITSDYKFGKFDFLIE